MDFNTSPFFDDFQTSAKNNNYHKILFIPGNAVQARELTQIQSILQEQIKRNADNVFQNGTMVVPGHVFYDNKAVYLKISASYGNVSTSVIGASLVGKQLQGTSGVVAQVIHYEPATVTDPDTLFVKYVAANGTVHDFTQGEVLFSSDLNASLQILSTSSAIGVGSLVTVNQGIYYINGFFVGVSTQTMVLDKYDSLPSYIAGLSFSENVVNATQDPTLYDNALGFSNYASLGAERYQINLVLTKKNIDYTDLPNQQALQFIPLLKVVNGNIQYLLKDTQYSQIEKMLARRTFDSSGDFIVSDFTIVPKNYRTNNRNTWTANTPYLQGDIVTNNNIAYMALNNGYSGTTIPSQAYGQASDGGIYWLQTNTPEYNGGVYQSSSTTLQDHINDESKLAIQTSKGKAYVKGFEVEVQDRRTSVTSKARDITQKNNIQLFSPNGTYISITNVLGIVDTSTMTKVNLVGPDSVVRGTAYATAMEYSSGTIGTSGAIYNLYLIGVNLNVGYDITDDIATIVSTIGSTFSATINHYTLTRSGFVSVNTGSNIVTGQGTLFTQELSNGDQIQIAGVNVLIQSITNDNNMVLSTNWTASNVINNAYFSLVVDMVNTGEYIQKLPNVYMRNIRLADGSIDTSYTILKTISFSASGTSYASSLTIPGEYFNGIQGHIVVDTSNNAIINATYSLDTTSTILTINGLTNGHSYKMIAHVIRSGNAAREKTKTLVTKTIIATSTSITDDFNNVISNNWNFTSPKISLTKCDVQRVIKITMSGADGAYNATGESDVTSWFTLSNNNKINFYDISTIIRKTGIVAPSRALKITYEYFEHSSGDYFSVDSYASIPYNRIPVETHSNVTYNLRDCLDFRSRVEDDGLGFSGSGGNVSTPIYSSSTISTSYSYYLPRIDVISLSASGQFEYFTGVSSLNPVTPTIGDGSLQLAVLNLDPYTITAGNIAVTPTLHKRYTMSDINSIDTRLSNVEQVVALNQLEAKTSNLTIYNANGLIRFKNGFVADPFTDTSVGDVTSPDFKALINTSEGTLRCNSFSEYVPLVEPIGTTNASRLSSGYQVTGDWITLPYTEVALISQPLATHAENVNPFSVFSWTGLLKLTPQSDSFIDTMINKNITSVNGTTTYTNVYDYVYWGWIWANNE